MLQNIVDFKAKSFLTERNTSTMSYEVKAVRAIWDPSLSIPGTNRRGGWRCPVGTRYGGQITDRFGRSCGWGVARRIANQISDIGSRLENVDDARRGRRIARRERRILARLNTQEGGAGRLERGLRGVAERLDGGEAQTPRGGRRRTVTARPPSVDAPEAISESTPDAPRPQRRRRAPARPVREEGNLLAAEPTEVLEEMRAELENATGGRDSDDYKRVIAELKRREAPARPARRRQPARRRGGNLRESEQRRMDRELVEPGAPRTGEAPARRRRRAVVEATNNPKAPAKKPEAVVEPKVVKPRRPKPKENTEQRIERLIEEEAEISRRIRGRMLIDIGNPPKDFIQIGNGHWRKGDWFITRDQEDDRVLGLSASHPRKRGLIQARNFDDLVRKIEIADRLPSQPPPAPQPRRRNERQEANLNRVVGDQSFMEVLRDEYIPNDRIMIVNDARNFPQDPREKDKKVQAAWLTMGVADEYLRKINTAIARGEISDRDFVRMTMDSNAGPEEFSVARVKEIIEGYRDGWNEVRIANEGRKRPVSENLEKRPITPAPAPAARNPLPAGWNQGPNTIITHDNGDIIDKQIATNKWFVVFGRPSQSRAGFDNREDAIAWHKKNVLNRNASAVDPIDAPFIAPDKKDIRKAPDALKHKAPKIEVAKFTASQEEAIERILLEIADAEKLNKFSLAVDQANFYQNEGRQNALRNYQKRLAEIANRLRTDPRARMPAQVDAEIAQAKQALLRSVGGGDITTARARLNQLNNQLEEKFSQLRQPVGVGAAEIGAGRVQTMEQIGLIKQEMGNLEGVIEVLGSLDGEVRKIVERISQGYKFNPDATDIPKPTPQAVKAKIKEQIDGAINRRQGKLAKYLKERYPQGGAPCEDMTPEKWRGLSSQQKAAYVKEAYSHKLIKGKNGRFYNAVAQVNGNSIDVVFNEVNAEGQVIRARIGSSSRNIFYNSNQVYQQSMNVRSKLDRGADIQTIYNQHAFLYLSKIGITSAKVTAADDGQYVWARVGFKQSGGVDRARLQALVSELRFYEEFGAGGLISNDAEYARISSILKQAEGGTKFSHQDIIFAVDDVDDKARAEYVKQWFKSNIPFGGGVLKFADQKVAGVERTRRPRAPRVRV